jgi:hypothetical protein
MDSVEYDGLPGQAGVKPGNDNTEVEAGHGEAGI